MKVYSVFVCSVLVISVFLFSCSEDKDKNPAGPGNETYSISGEIITFSWMATDVFENVSILVIGDDIEITAFPDTAGLFQVKDLPPGNYTVTPIKDGFFFLPKSRKVTVVDTIEILPSIRMVEEGDPIFGEYPIVITVKITDSDSTGIHGVTLHITGDYKGMASDLEGALSETNYLGYGYFQVKIDSTYTIAPYKEGYDYTFEPESMEITFDEYSEYTATYEFTAINTGPPLHNISGQISGQIDEFNYLRVEIREKGEKIYTTYADSTGVYSFNGLKDGSYTLYYDGGDYRTYKLDPKMVTVTVEGDNVVVPDVIATVIGEFTPTTYSLSGRVADENGNGIPDTDIAMYAVKSDYHYDMISTDADGVYTREIQIGKKGSSIESETFVITPHKDCFTFSPADTTLTLFSQDNVEHGGEINAPFFTGHDHTNITAENYFPISTSITWTYKRTENDEEPYHHSVKVAGTVSHDGQIYHRLSDPGPWKFTDFRIEDNNVYAFSDDEEVLFLKFGVVPGTRWESGVIAGTYTRKGTFMGTETLETPAGTFDNCAHFESKIVYGETSYDSYDLWYAPGVGLVKSVKIVENYGRRLEYVVDELKEYEMP